MNYQDYLCLPNEHSPIAHLPLSQLAHRLFYARASERKGHYSWINLLLRRKLQKCLCTLTGSNQGALDLTALEA